MNRFLLTRVLTGAVALIAIALMFATDVSAQTLSTNSDPGATLYKGVRYRVLNQSCPSNTGTAEVQVFDSPYPGSLPTEKQGCWSIPANKNISIKYDGSKLFTTAAGVTTERIVGNLGDLNYIQIQITKNGPTNSVAFESISLGSGSLGSASVNAAPNTQVWKITGANLTSEFTLTGTLALVGLSGGGDSNFLQVEVGYVAPPDSKGPVTSSVATSPIPAILNGQVTVTANVSDETTGNNNVASASYELNGAGPVALSASDGSFNSPNEDVEATVTATQLGINEVCVSGTDALGNVGGAACQTFLVTYNFTGFYSPIDNLPVNIVKAGQAIPAKWRLTDANNVPIDDPDSFVNLSSYDISCTDFSGDPLDAVEEVASGSSGLQYVGDGYWQFNWKTPKTYADTCRAMYVEFNSGATSPVVKFKFRK